MAQKVQTLFIDDIDGGEAAGTVRFGLDGAQYEIDLSDKNAETMRNAMAKYIEVARRTTLGLSRSRSRAGTHRATSAMASDIDTSVVRAWAREHDITINERGRIPGIVVTAWRQGDPEIARAATPAASTAEPAASEPEPAPAASSTQDAEPKASATKGAAKPRAAKAPAKSRARRGAASADAAATS